jgi:hypothetical protein
MTCEDGESRDNLHTAKVMLFVPDPATTLEEGYDRIKIERTKRGVGSTFKEVLDLDDAIVIQDGVYNYVYIDPNAEADWLYKPFLADSTGTEPDRPQAVRAAVDSSYEAVMTIEELRTLYLFGVDLTDDANRPYPAELFAHYLRSAIAHLEHLADLTLIPTKVIERHDYYRRDFQKFCFLQLFRSPVISVQAVAVEYPLDNDVLSFPASSIRLDRHAGQVQILPTAGNMTQMLVSAGGAYLPLFFGGVDHIPDLLRVEYFAGFELGKIPENLKQYVGMLAAVGPLNIAGDLVAGAGIMSKSISIDGLSKSLSTTNSSTNAGYGARLLEYRKSLKSLEEVIKKFYGGGRLSVVA